MGLDDPVAKTCLEEIKNAKSPEEAARIGRRTQRQRPDLVSHPNYCYLHVFMKVVAVSLMVRTPEMRKYIVTFNWQS